MCNLKETNACPSGAMLDPRLIDPTEILFGTNTSHLPMRERTRMLENETRYAGPGVGTGILVGPPGVGKSTIIEALTASGEIKVLPLTTTRQAVASDTPSLDRNFVTPDQFAEMREAGELLAISDKSGAQGNYKMGIATQALIKLPRPFILDKTFAGWNKLLDEMAGDPDLDKTRIQILASHHFIFLLPTDMLTLSRRLYHRNRYSLNSGFSKDKRREELRRGKELTKLLEDSCVPNISYIVNDEVERVVNIIYNMLHGTQSLEQNLLIAA